MTTLSNARIPMAPAVSVAGVAVPTPNIRARQMTRLTDRVAGVKS
jgi:hypothetical protein